MPHDTDLAARVRAALPDRGAVREVAMFGGLAFLVEDRMVVCVSTGGGDLLVRVARERDPELVTRPGARRAEMGAGRTMGEGWIAVDRSALGTERDLQDWVDAALELHARGTPRGRPAGRPGAGGPAT